MAVVVHGLKGVIIFCTTQNNPLVVKSQRGSVDETVRKVWLRQYVSLKPTPHGEEDTKQRACVLNV